MDPASTAVLYRPSQCLADIDKTLALVASRLWLVDHDKTGCAMRKGAATDDDAGAVVICGSHCVLRCRARRPVIT